jgi:hypothetical protein
MFGEQVTDANLDTPLHIFAEGGNLDAVRLLVLEAGAEFGRIALNCQKKSPMEVAGGACKVRDACQCRGSGG